MWAKEVIANFRVSASRRSACVWMRVARANAFTILVSWGQSMAAGNTPSCAKEKKDRVMSDISTQVLGKFWCETHRLTGTARTGRIGVCRGSNQAIDNASLQLGRRNRMMKG